MRRNKAIPVIVLLVAVVAVIAGRYLYNKPRLVNGDMAIEIAGQGPDGRVHRLSDLRGYYVLLEFWGSWCGPCRKENPRWVALYRSLQDKRFSDGKGFRIFSYGIERDPQSWQRAIRADSLFWETHVSGLEEFADSAAVAYGVRSIPTNFLVDPAGRIIGVNMSDTEVRKLLDNRLLND